MMHTIPRSLAPFFQEYDITSLNPATASFTIIERILQFGNREKLRWLFTVYSRTQIADWVRRFGRDCLPQPHRTFWKIILLDFFSPTDDIPTIRPVLEEALFALEAKLVNASSGNLVYVVQDVQVRFYGYGYELVRPPIEKESLRLASTEDIGLMRLDSLLGRAARKDFYDLYFICRKISLKQLLNLAPKKYPSVRDFEAQAVKRLVFFESAEAESDPPLLEPVAWQTVKDYFTLQAKEIGQNGLQ